MVKNVTEQLINPVLPKVLPHEQHLVYMPVASTEQMGISKFYKDHFNVVNGEVKIKPAYIRSLLEDSFYRSISTIKYENDMPIWPLDLNVQPSTLPMKYGATIWDSELSVEEKMSKYIGTNDRFLFFPDANVSDELALMFYLPTIFNVGKLQLYIRNNYWKTSLKVYVSEYDTNYEEADSMIIPAQKWSAELNGTYTGVYTFNINKYCKYIKIVASVTDNAVLDVEAEIQNPGFMRGRFCIVGAELFQRTISGKYIYKQGNGNEFTTDCTDGSFVEQYTNESKHYKDEAFKHEINARNYYNNLLQLKDVRGGVAGIGDDGFISTDVIPPIVKHEYLLINSEDDLTVVTEDLQVGDIAYTVEEILDEDKKPTGTYKLKNSWILLADYEGAYLERRNWIEQSSYTSGSAAYAKQAGTAAVASKVGTLYPIALNGVISEKEYEALEDNTGVYLVSIYDETGE